MLFERRGGEGGGAAGSTSFNVAEQGGRGKYPRCPMPFDMAEWKARGVVTTFDAVRQG